jgi:uncharacterized membrane protein
MDQLIRTAGFDLAELKTEYAERGSHGPHNWDESAREILDRRYARGEISREEYQQVRRDLE